VSPAGDKTIVCRDCGQEFVFSAGEQQFYASRGLSEPTRCSGCRAARKASRESGGYGESGSGHGSSGYDRDTSYDRGGYGGGGYDRSSRSSSGSRSGQPRQMFQVICDDCGTTTEVPFEPRAGRPVYCRSCYERRRGTG
jgi:CxxC-x17-CxxC domain-containing protein